MTVIVTGAAGFIGFHTARALLQRGETVVGVDNMNDYYDVSLKEARLAELEQSTEFTFAKLDIASAGAFADLVSKTKDLTSVVNLAAQAGVRYSLDHPEPYVETNVVGHLYVLEACRHAGSSVHLVYASSSSVYGANDTLPFSVSDRVDHPVSLYAATKRSAELISESYSHLYRIPQTGLRFFTVYGPWGRPDMSAYIFTKAILEGQPIRVFNRGNMQRDFTYIDDITAGVLAAIDRPPADGETPPHRIYNLGNHRTEKLMRFIELIEAAAGEKSDRGTGRHAARRRSGNICKHRRNARGLGVRTANQYRRGNSSLRRLVSGLSRGLRPPDCSRSVPAHDLRGRGRLSNS